MTKPDKSPISKGEYIHSSPSNSLASLSTLISKHQLSAKKSLGQHFLLNQNLIDRIANVADVNSSTVIEVGPGPGGLTRSLLKHGARKIIAIEKDSRCINALKELQNLYPDHLEIVQGDALNVALSSLASPPYVIVANLPYNISSTLLLKWLKEGRKITKMTLMFQKEVADRLVASPNTKSYSRLSIITQWLCEIRLEFNIKASAFVPPPNVTSTLVTLIPHKKPIAKTSWRNLEAVTKAAFNQRRKMLKTSLKTFNFDFSKLRIEPNLRAENLTVEQFCQLANSINQ